MSLPVILLAGGGTGGHVFPMVAVADALRQQANVRVVYVGTARGIENRVVKERGDELELLDVAPIKGKGPLFALRGMGKAALVLPRARALVKKLDAKAVLSVGGYAAGPVALAAWTASVPVAILEPNGILGLTNRWLRPFAKRAYVAFPEVERQFAPSVVLRTGVPLRRAFAPAPYRPDPSRFRVLILGGSQGAVALNEVVPQALSASASRIRGLEVVHQCGRDKDAELRARYESLGLSKVVEVLPFIDDVASELEAADLVMGRAGASALAELCAIGRPSILIPFPFAADDHQRKNAESLERAGAALCIAQSEADIARLSEEVIALSQNAARRIAMADAARERGVSDAAERVARDLLRLAGLAPLATNEVSHV